MVWIVEVACVAHIPAFHRHGHLTPQAGHLALQVGDQVAEVVAHPRVTVPGCGLGEVDRCLAVVVVQQDVTTEAEQGSDTLRGRTLNCWKREGVRQI